MTSGYKVGWTTEMDEQIRTASEGTMTYVSLAESLKLNVNTVKLRASALGYRKVQDHWPQYAVDILRDNWKDHSAREIAIMIGKTRNAVIGKAGRLKLDRKRPNSNRLSRAKTEKPENKEKRVHKRTPKPPTPIVEAKPIGNRTPIGIMELRKTTCRATVGYDHKGLATYCGCETFPGKSFCPAHCRLFYVSRVA